VFEGGRQALPFWQKLDSGDDKSIIGLAFSDKPMCFMKLFKFRFGVLF
jgi:hypothetical protein